MKSNIRKIRSQLLQPASAGNGADLVNCKFITADPRNSEPGLRCSVIVIEANKMSLQELSELSADFRFPEIFYS